MKKQEKILIIGNGSWGNRLYEKLEIDYGEVFIRPARERIIQYLYDYKKIYICVPSVYFIEVINKFKDYFSSPHIEVISCCKGLLDNGNTPMEELKERGMENVKHLGGACIEKNEIIKITDDIDFEKLSILKNVYAIGFAYWLEKEGINYASKKLLQYFVELEQITNITRTSDYHDLIATCFSEKSRNHKFGKYLADPIKYIKELPDTIEGYSSAKIISEYNLIPNAEHIQDIVYLINKI